MLLLPCLFNVLLQYLDEAVCTIMMRFLKQSVFDVNTGKYLLSVDVENTDIILKHDREMEIGELQKP